MLNRQGTKVIGMPLNSAIINLFCTPLQIPVNGFTFKDPNFKRIRGIDFQWGNLSNISASLRSGLLNQFSRPFR